MWRFFRTLVYFPKKKDDDLRMMTQGKYGGIGALIQQREVPIQQAGTPASRKYGSLPAWKTARLSTKATQMPY